MGSLKTPACACASGYKGMYCEFDSVSTNLSEHNQIAARLIDELSKLSAQFTEIDSQLKAIDIVTSLGITNST